MTSTRWPAQWLPTSRSLPGEVHPRQVGWGREPGSDHLNDLSLSAVDGRAGETPSWPIGGPEVWMYGVLDRDDEEQGNGDSSSGLILAAAADGGESRSGGK